MDYTILLGIFTTIFSGVSLFQFFTIKSLKREKAAEAKIKEAQAREGEASVDTIKLSNLEKYLDVMGEQLVKSQQENVTLRDQNTNYMKQLDALNYKLSAVERKIAGMQKTIDLEIARRKNAEENECEVENCPNRKRNTQNQK
jgi:predicted  nucleic acid-binding Zn-ribbon protein